MQSTLYLKKKKKDFARKVYNEFFFIVQENQKAKKGKIQGNHMIKEYYQKSYFSLFYLQKC